MTNDQAEAIEFLSSDVGGGRARRIDTHASIVFLAPDRALKIKRAVKLSFLDYSTIAQRERFIRAEFELNRRTAPALYRRVRRITRAQSGGLEWDGAGPLLEPALEMARFGDDALFDHLAAAGQLTPTLMVKLGDIIAQFHAGAEITPAFGGSAGIAAVIADNDTNLAAACPPLERDAVVALREAEQQALGRCAQLLDRRRAESKVRRCHGDLHLRNICLFDGEPTLFDCIEFSDDFACIDTLFDFAFLLMDIEHRGLRALGNLLFNRYLDRSQETSGIGALPLLMSVRAAIRAKAAVAALKLQANAAAEARAYLDLAQVLLRPAAPRLIAIGGLSGSGKSTVAAALAADFLPAPGARHIRSDVVRKSFMQVPPETKLPPSAYTEEVSATVYRLAGEQAATALASGYAALVDATFMNPRERAAIEGIARRAQVPFTGLWLTAPDRVLLDRVAARTGDASDADRAVLLQQLQADIGTVSWARVDVSGDVAAAITGARQALAPGP